MMFLKNTTASFFLFCFLTASSCKKDNSGPVNTAPTNLEITATVSTDGTGNVSFSATANNAVTYDFEYGDGVVLTGTNGNVTHRYTLTGTNTFTVRATAKSSTGATATKTISVTVTVTITAPVLVWSDEFNTDGLPNPAKWGYDLGAGGWGNNEAQYYTSRADNAVVINGSLKITLKKEAYSGSNYTSARLLTKDKFSFKYGRVEARAKLPAGGGTWPAIWMLGSNIGTVGWPACGEIDIMEHIGNDLNRIHGTLHYPGRFGGNANGSSRVIANATTEFHIYSLDWSPTEIKISVDDQLIHTVANSASIPFNHNFFIICNVAMGGNFGGIIDAGVTNASMEIDYIRVYQ
ncbi:MAG TPA: family 16 glycosylhydrolase [Ferruginibacter sp.]|nr:family 16 glycosylhydrolase [Ferruginibacter sp.]HMP19419.1 family 16 glycosylhydrolase [Ferruginibacter sp.]